MIEPLQQTFMQRAFLEVLLLGIVCGPLGVWILFFRQAYAAESLTHAMLPGLALAALLGFPLFLGAGIGVIAAAIAIAIVALRLGSGAPVAVVVTGFLGVGALLALTPTTPARLSDLLFGDLLALTYSDIAITTALTVIVGVGLLAAKRQFTLVVFNANSSKSLGVSSTQTTMLLLSILALTIVIGSQGLGNLLLVSLLLGPAAAAQQLTARLSTLLILAGFLAILSGIIGLYLSYYFDLAAGGSVALVAVSTFGISALLRQLFKKQRLQSQVEDRQTDFAQVAK